MTTWERERDWRKDRYMEIGRSCAPLGISTVLSVENSVVCARPKRWKEQVGRPCPYLSKLGIIAMPPVSFCSVLWWIGVGEVKRIKSTNTQTGGRFYLRGRWFSSARNNYRPKKHLSSFVDSLKRTLTFNKGTTYIHTGIQQISIARL